VFQINPQIAYLLGLITGKGYIENNNIISIEFPCNNQFIEGIASCPKCNWLATKPKNANNLKCKNPNCLKDDIDASKVKKTYDQSKSFYSSVKSIILPFLETGINLKGDVISSKTCTFLTLTIEDDLYKFIKNIFNPAINFFSMKIPDEVSSFTKECKIEYINGLLDTIGYANAGGWIPRDGKNNHGRMRVYFQVVKNYELPVSIDNFLRSEFNLPIQTIDWGHPNIRDAKLEDFFKGKSSSFGREHQVKFFPEYYEIFKFRIESKQKLFEELLQHNKNAQFKEREDWLDSGIKELKINQVKSFHPNEDNLSLDKRVRKHFDAFWQINLAMGCKFIQSIKNNSSIPDLFEKTGIQDYRENSNNIIEEFNNKSQILFNDIQNKYQSKLQSKTKTTLRNNFKLLDDYPKEKDTYPVLVEWLKKFIKDDIQEDSGVYDTSLQTISNFSSNDESLFSRFNNLDQLSIKPDVVGISKENFKTFFIESKITILGLKELGQLIGYCMVANPDKAFLISTKTISDSLLKSIQRNRNILQYFNKEVRIGTLKKDQVEFLNI